MSSTRIGENKAKNKSLFGLKHTDSQCYSIMANKTEQQHNRTAAAAAVAAANVANYTRTELEEEMANSR